MPIRPLLYTMAVPLMLSLLVQSLYNIVDSIFVARLSETALTAASLVYSIQFLMIAVGVGTAVGLNALLSRKIGEHKPEEACRAATTGLFLMIFTSLIFSMIGIFLSDTIATKLAANSELQELCKQYLSINLVYCWGIFLQTYAQRLLQAVGDTVLSMLSLIIGAVLNIILDPIFIFWLDMGVKGAALATVLSQACSAVWVLSFLFSRRASLPLERRYMKLEKSIVLSMLALGVSPFIMASTESLVGFVLNSSLKEFGDIYVSALTVLQTSMQFASVPLTGFAQGFVPVASYNYGHGDKQRVKECFRIALITMFSFNLVLMLFMICFPAIVASAFTSDARLIETVRWTMPVFLGGMTIFGLQRACQNMFVALGQARISIFIALLRKVILLIPLALILPHFMGVAGVYAAEAISDATAAICCTLLFFWQFPKILRRIKSKSLSE